MGKKFPKGWGCFGKCWWGNGFWKYFLSIETYFSQLLCSHFINISTVKWTGGHSHISFCISQGIWLRASLGHQWTIRWVLCLCSAYLWRAEKTSLYCYFFQSCPKPWVSMAWDFRFWFLWGRLDFSLQAYLESLINTKYKITPLIFQQRTYLAGRYCMLFFFPDQKCMRNVTKTYCRRYE